MGKGVSAAEKKERMLKMFREASAPFTKKDVEKYAPKTGIIAQAVEGVLKELVSDDLVREAKIGGTTFFWSFPGEAATKKRAAPTSKDNGGAGGRQSKRAKKKKQDEQDDQDSD